MKATSLGICVSIMVQRCSLRMGNSPGRLLLLIILLASVQHMMREYWIPESVLFGHTNNSGVGLESGSCVLPKIPMFPTDNAHKNTKPLRSACTEERTLFNLSQDGLLTILPPFNERIAACCIQYFLEGNDDRYITFTFSQRVYPCKPLPPRHQIRYNQTIFLVRCGSRTQLDFFLSDTIVKEKKGFWEKPENARPKNLSYSVFILGIDTVSRAHAHRSLPRTMKFLLDKLNFVEFSAFHSLQPHTLPNLCALLSGYRIQYVETESCTPRGNFSFIWDGFNARNYLTGFINDGAESLGAIPDFYILLQTLRIQWAYENTLFEDCLSYNEVPLFLLKYGQRFLEQFQSWPFFFMTWMGQPFHDDVSYLRSFDEDLFTFFKFISNSRELLERTVIILLSDHGDRFGALRSISIESFMEVSLPPLLVRLPDALRREFPHLEAILQQNSRVLTTPYDLHQTMAHLLALPNIPKSQAAAPFRPDWKNRTSLLSPFELNRTCSSTGVHVFCMCNFGQDGESDKNFRSTPKLSKSLLTLSLYRLNLKVENYTHGHLCGKWTSEAKDITLLKRLGAIDLYPFQYDHFLIGFRANGGKAMFEAWLLYLPKDDLILEATQTQINRAGATFRRTNAYGNQSDCLPQKTFMDKVMREFCICKK